MDLAKIRRKFIEELSAIPNITITNTEGLIVSFMPPKGVAPMVMWKVLLKQKIYLLPCVENGSVGIRPNFSEKDAERCVAKIRVIFEAVSNCSNK